MLHLIMAYFKYLQLQELNRLSVLTILTDIDTGAEDCIYHLFFDPCSVCSDTVGPFPEFSVFRGHLALKTAKPFLLFHCRHGYMG